MTEPYDTTRDLLDKVRSFDRFLHVNNFLDDRFGLPLAKEAHWREVVVAADRLGVLLMAGPSTRHNDPVTSHEAEPDRLRKLHSMHTLVDRIVRGAGPDGRTDEEIYAAWIRLGHPDRDASRIRHYRSDLRDHGKIRDSGTTRPSKRGSAMKVWVSAAPETFETQSLL